MTEERRHEEPKPQEQHDEEGYPQPKSPLAANWVQPKRPFNPDGDYLRLPRFCPDYGRAPLQAVRRGRS